MDNRANGNRERERVGYRRSEAVAALESRMTDIRRERFDGILPEPTCTLNEIWRRYLAHSIATKSPMQVEREKGIYKNHLKSNFGTIPLNEITPEQVEGFQATRKGENKAASTINKEVQLLKNITKKAVEWKRIRTNQIAGVKPFKEPPGRVRYLEFDQYVKLIAVLPKWLRPIVIVTAFTGMRRGEVCTLKRENIDLKTRQIILEETKNGDRRVIPMNQTVYEVIIDLPPRLDTLYLFAGEDGEPLKLERVSVTFKRKCKTAGIENFCFHDLRHHFASWLTMKGQNQRTLMELLGHKDPKMTTRYQHLSPEHLRNAVEMLDQPTQKVEAKG